MASERITIDPEVCGGRPCIRGMRITVSQILELLAGGMTRAQILEDFAYLESADVDACLQYKPSVPSGGSFGVGPEQVAGAE